MGAFMTDRWQDKGQAEGGQKEGFVIAQQSYG